MPTKRSRFRTKPLTPLGLGVCFGGALLASQPAHVFGQTPESGSSTRLENLEKENKDLRKRLDALESVAKKEGIMPSDTPIKKAVTALSEMNLSGFVSTSYFYDTSDPDDNSSNGYLWNRRHNSFSINKVKLTLASAPVERSGEKWAAGYRASLIFGEDAPVVNTGRGQGFDELREAYVELNVPIGTGLNVKAGQLISLLNFESGDGGAVNPNFSQGYQWFFTGNGPSAGVQLGYEFSDKVDLKVRVQNGLYAGAVDGNGYKTVMGSLGIKPDSKTSISLIGFGGREGKSSSEWLKGGSIIASRQLTEKNNLNFATEISYFHLDLPTDTADWWSIGGWVWADFTPKIGLAFRADYIGDGKGAATSGSPGPPLAPLLGFGVHSGQDLCSATLTLNIRPLPNIKIQPEIRYDHTSLKDGFDGDQDRVIIGAGVSYLF